MAEHTEFSSIISRLVSGGYKENSVTFMEIYTLQLLENWKPWPYLPDEFFQKCLFACHLSDRLQEKFRMMSASSDKIPKRHSVQKPFHDTPSLNITGHPLQIVCEFDIAGGHGSLSLNTSSAEMAICEPLPMKNIMWLFDLYKKCWINNVGLKNIPLYVLCNGKDENRTILLGFSAKRHVKATAEKTFADGGGCVSLKRIKEKHLSNISNPSGTTSSVYIYYDIQKSGAELKKDLILNPDPTESKVVALECTGADPSCILQRPNNNSKCLMVIQAVIGHYWYGAYKQFRDLRSLKELLVCLKTGQRAWSAQDQASGVFERLNKIFEGMTLPENMVKFVTSREKYQDVHFVKDEDFNSKLDLILRDGHPCEDITDLLWAVLSGCSNIGELAAAFQMAFNAVKKLPRPLPYIRKNNQTGPANMIRRILEDSSFCPSLISANALYWLFDIGVQRLKMFYTYLFLSLQMASGDLLAPFLNEFQDPESALNCLQKFHTVVELIIICRSMLLLPMEELREFVQFTLRHYATVTTVDPSYIFRFPVPLDAVKSVLNRIHPVVWRVNFKTSGENIEKYTYVELTRNEEASKFKKGDLKQIMHHVSTVNLTKFNKEPEEISTCCGMLLR